MIPSLRRAACAVGRRLAGRSATPRRQRNTPTRRMPPNDRSEIGLQKREGPACRVARPATRPLLDEASGELITPLSRKSSRSSPVVRRSRGGRRATAVRRRVVGSRRLVVPVVSGRACGDAGAAAASVALVVSVLLPGRPTQGAGAPCAWEQPQRPRAARESGHEHSEVGDVLFLL